MQNIDPVALLEPVLYVILSVGVVAYWKYRRRLTASVMLLSAVAYFLAIALKTVLQEFTYSWMVSTFGATSIPTGLYFGLQTSIFEVGLAYGVARFAVGRKQLDGRDAEGYGVALAFWENGVLLGALVMLNLALDYIIIAEGLLPQSVYQTLVNADPSLFYAPSQLLVPTAFGFLERVSSLLLHFSWGYLCVLAAYLGKKKYLVVALPMGVVDALVPFAGFVALWVFEATVFLLALGALLVTWRVTERDRRSGYVKVLTTGMPAETA